ncbi:hypothetical protein ACFCYC_33195, partial [Streptomyces sp. NPDC056402]|uniref:hypothetical protein n=1 Tax=Streptomyces sp. NPDC056402 TaxID=3345810 RepID=UPI0035D813B7
MGGVAGALADGEAGDGLAPGEGAPLVGVSFRHVTEVATHRGGPTAPPPTTSPTAAAKTPTGSC